MKKWLWTIGGIGCFLVGLVSLSWLLSKHEMLIYEDHEQTITVQEIPYIPVLQSFLIKQEPNKAVLTIASPTVAYQANLNFDLVRPELFIYSEDTKSLFIIYFADLSYEFLALKIQESLAETSAQHAWLIEPSHRNIHIRDMTSQELKAVSSLIEQFSEKEYQAHAVPILDFGFYKCYASQKYLLELLTEEIDRRIFRQKKLTEELHQQTLPSCN